MNFADRVVAAWYTPRPTAVSVLLIPFALLFRAAVALRRSLYRAGVLRSERLPVPVVVVGNITVGGTGKTPLTAQLAALLSERGYRPGIVSRGYGGSAQAPRGVTTDDDPAVVGDEPPILAAAGFPVWIGADRVAAARGLLHANPRCNVVISDDGLSHYRLARNVEIAVIDGARGVGNGLLLPAGPLREPESRLEGVDAIVTLVADGSARGTPGARASEMTYAPLPWRNVADAARVAQPAEWRGREVHAVAGIGNPQRFFAELRAQGISAIEHPLPDHHVYRAGDLAYPDAAAILMTQKDAVKCKALADARCWYMPVRAMLDPALVSLVETKIRGSQTA